MQEEEVARDNILLLKEEVERLGKEKQSEIQYLRERLNWVSRAYVGPSSIRL